MRKITAAAGAGFAALALAAAPAAAQAATRPAPKLPVVYSQVDGWHGGQERHAVRHIDPPGCMLPSYESPYQRFPVSVPRARVEPHAGVRYYSRMSWAY